jgi:ribosomal protein L5
MQVLEHFCRKNLKYNFINKFDYKSLKSLFEFKKIVLMFKNENSNLKKIATHLLILELLTSKKGIFVKSKKQSVILKIKVGNPVGCKIILSKKIMFKFLKKLIFGVFLFKKNHILNLNKNKNSFLFSLKNIIKFFNYKKFYNIFSNLKILHLIIIININLKKEKMLFF